MVGEFGCKPPRAWVICPRHRIGQGSVFWRTRMAGNQRGQAIPTQLGLAEFEQFGLPDISVGSRGPAPKLSFYKTFNYILRLLYLGCQ
jgi:hypothetical protein